MCIVFNTASPYELRIYIYIYMRDIYKTIVLEKKSCIKCIVRNGTDIRNQLHDFNRLIIQLSSMNARGFFLIIFFLRITDAKFELRCSVAFNFAHSFILYPTDRCPNHTFFFIFIRFPRRFITPT